VQLDDALLTKLEKLSALEIEPQKREGILNQLSEIVSFVENLNELDLDHEEATFTTVAGGTPFREDEPQNNPAIIQTILDNAPERFEGFFVVPKIIE
jgi:aspartyl-tRNA(Asn)/glutamyl-tRNA(Gln) amidotransferase subunit C